MATIKKIKMFGYFDISTSITQLLVTSASTGLSLYFHFKKMKKDGGGTFMSYFAPTFILLSGALVVYTHIGQLIAVWKLIKAAVHGAFDEDLNEARNNWGCWNGASCIVVLTWYPMIASITFHEYNWPLAYIGASFVVIAGARIVLTGIFYKMLDEEDDDDIPPMEDYMMEPPLEMQEIRHQGWL